MQQGTRYSLINVDKDGHQARLVICGQPTSTIVDGVAVEAQFDVAGGQGLIFLTEDSPHDEGLHVYLVGDEGTIEDAVEAGSTFSAGMLEIKDVRQDSLDLHFFQNDVLYRIELRSRREFRFFLPAGWRYKRRLRGHRLIVRSTARTENSHE
jgi:hypothetical protein